MPKIAYLGIGSNLGSRINAFTSAIKLLRTKGSIKSTSFLYQTSPLYNLNQNYFLNAVLKYHTELSPFQLLAYLKDIEKVSYTYNF